MASRSHQPAALGLASKQRVGVALGQWRGHAATDVTAHIRGPCTLLSTLSCLLLLFACWCFEPTEANPAADRPLVEDAESEGEEDPPTINICQSLFDDHISEDVVRCVLLLFIRFLFTWPVITMLFLLRPQ